MHENELWHFYKEGDVKALESLYERYQTPLSNYGFRFTPDYACIEETLEELFLRLWQQREWIAKPAVIKQYLYLTFRRSLLQRLEYGLPRYGEAQNEELIPFNIELNGDHPWVAKERMLALADKAGHLLPSLSNRQREALFLKFYEELSYEQIADIMHMSMNSARRLLYQAIEYFRNKLHDFTLLSLLYVLKRR
jgi:RNA polymerase sigma factor (sigma-70 family)